MKLDRRAFVKTMAFGGGSALGLMLSPAPWYLVRDLAFWTQNWSWAPAPEPGESVVQHATCRFCEGGCGIEVRRVDERLVHIDGSKNHPVNKGAICPLATAGLQLLYSPARLKEPIRQIGSRDNPEWEPISWSQAMAEITGRIRELRGAGKSHTVACIAGNAESAANELFERLLTAIGSNNFVKTPSATEAQNLAFWLMQGLDGNAAWDIENTRYVLSFGCDLLGGWSAPGRMQSAFARLLDEPEETRMQVVQIEPNLSVTAAKMSRWVPIEPGAEGALALAIAHVLIRDSLYDKAFVEKHCFGFDDWRDGEGESHRGFKTEVLAGYSPKAAELITQIPAREIEELAYEFARNRPSLAIGGRGSGDRIVDIYELMAIHSLNALVGNINQRGGVLRQSRAPISRLPEVKPDKKAIRGLSAKRKDGSFPLQTEYGLAGLTTDEINLLFLHETNPYYMLPDGKTADAIFTDVPFIVSFSSYRDESSARADLILPIAASFERWDDHVGVPGLQYPVYSLNHPLVEPAGQARNAGDVVIEIARQLGGAVADSFPWMSVTEVIRERARGLYKSGGGMICGSETNGESGQDEISGGFSAGKYSTFSEFWAGLVQSGCWFDPSYAYGDPSRFLLTASGKFEFFSQTLRRELKFAEDILCLPHYNPPIPNPEGFDLTLMPEDILSPANREIGMPAMLMKQLGNDVLVKNDLFVRMNIATAVYHGLRDGDSAILESSYSKVKVRVNTFAGVREGVVLVPLGFGHTAYDQYLQDKGINAYRLIGAERDPVTGLSTWWATPGKISRV
ncbi:molybdopterin-dependent oxidoreductase [Candidatus Poribacteria bacterium]|nr:molybdopterin-dependent oxidoreductase [Candidatus Poribacteria bacterium]